MTRLSSKTQITRQFSTGKSLQADFILPEIEATIRDKGCDCLYERAYLCPCKDSASAAPLSLCRNCGGVGWIWCNPTKTRMIVSGIASDSKMKEAALREFGMIDMGAVKITAIDVDKFTYMDRITILEATAQHNQIIYPKLTDDEDIFFAFTKYNILDIDNIAFYNGSGAKLTRLFEPTDYLFQDNIITFIDGYSAITNFSVSIRYSHRPVFHIIDILRESMTSTKGQYPQGQEKLIMPIHAIAKRAHLIKDVENYNGDRLLDNSWLPQTCETPDLTKFQRQLRYTTAQDIFDNLTAQQITDLDVLIHS